MAPFAVGLIIPPLLYLAAPRNLKGAARFWSVYGSALVIGALISLFMGELGRGLPEAIVAIVIDSSLVLAGSQVGYWLFWKGVIETRLATAGVASAKR